jgi:flavin reductase (DIM6/NTAB) family NADH-FMN oxidoreductase RutF
MTMGKYEELEKAGAALSAIGEKSALLVTGTDKPNAMTIGWAMASVMWGKSLFVAPVRKSRYSHGLLEAHGEFTVLVPSGDMKQAVAVCGSKSGRDTDKIAACGLTLMPSSAVQVPHIKAPGLVLECRVIYKTDFVDEALDDAVRAQWYGGRDAGNLHTLYFGEIVAQYEQA